MGGLLPAFWVKIAWSLGQRKSIGLGLFGGSNCDLPETQTLGVELPEIDAKSVLVWPEAASLFLLVLAIRFVLSRSLPGGLVSNTLTNCFGGSILMVESMPGSEGNSGANSFNPNTEAVLLRIIWLELVGSLTFDNEALLKKPDDWLELFSSTSSSSFTL